MTTNEGPLVSLRKEEPPPRGSGGGRQKLSETYAKELAAMAAEPGEWFAFLDYGERTAVAVSAKSRLLKMTTDYEFVARQGVVYGRYLNEDTADEEVAS